VNECDHRISAGIKKGPADDAMDHNRWRKQIRDD